MTETAKWRLGGAAMIVIGLGLILFGGSKAVSGGFIEIFGLRSGHEESEPMSRFESFFWGVALIVGGIFVLKWLG